MQMDTGTIVAIVCVVIIVVTLIAAIVIGITTSNYMKEVQLKADSNRKQGIANVEVKMSAYDKLVKERRDKELAAQKELRDMEAELAAQRQKQIEEQLKIQSAVKQPEVITASAMQREQYALDPQFADDFYYIRNYTRM